MMELDQIVCSRRSVRGFQQRPVDRKVILELLELAQRTPSNCNVQPWRVFLASGAARDRLCAALLEAFDRGDGPSPEFPIQEYHGPYRNLQIECAVALYCQMGVGRQDREGRQRAARRNFELFDAPHTAIICMDKAFGMGTAVAVGMYIQTLMLLMTSRGIASCAQAALRYYPDIVRRELAIPDHLHILCGVSFGYEDPAVPANRTRQQRQPYQTNVTLCDE